MALSKQQITIYLTMVGIGTGVGIASGYWFSPAPPAPVATTTPVAIPVNLAAGGKSSRAINLDFVVSVVAKVSPAVVKIDVVQGAEATSADRLFPEKTTKGTGSGFILSANGQIVTNAHVVANATIVTATLKDGRTLSGQVVGIDPVTDLAVVKVTGLGLPIVSIGNSDTLVAGEWAIAIGNPLGLDHSITLGIISATSRSSTQVGIPDKRVSFIQTDAAINPGNSGGPLLNAQGEVIGMNTAIRPDAQGLGFAIPIKTVQRVANQILATGSASHPYLGIRMLEITDETRSQLDRDLQSIVRVNRGVVIINVIADTPAARAGLQRGDVLQKVGNKVVNSPNDVQEQVDASEIGATLVLEINRGGQVQNLSVQTESYPTTEP